MIIVRLECGFVSELVIYLLNDRDGNEYVIFFEFWGFVSNDFEGVM